MAEEKVKQPKQKPSKKQVIIMSSVGAVLIVVGVALGTVLGKLVFVQEVDHSDIDIAALEDNQTQLMSKYNSASGSTIDQYISKFKPYELTNIGFNLTGKHEKLRSVGKGLVLANVSGIKVNQDIRSNFVKDGTDIFSESISASSMVKVAKRFYQDKTTVKYYNGKFKELEASEFNTNSLVKTYTLKEFEDEWGRDFTRPTIYIISSKTVKSSEVKKLDDKINVTLELDPFTSVARYVKQMRMTSDLKKDPNFSKVSIEVTLDKNLNLLTSTVTESYKTYYAGVWADTSGSLTETLFYDEVDTKVPGLDQNSNYNMEVA